MDLIPISKTSYGSSMEHMQVSVATERDPCPIQDSTTSITVSFNSVGLMVSSALFPQISRRPESLSIVNLDSSVNSTEAHCCCVQETCSLAQHKRFLRCRPLRGTTNWSSCIRPAL
ncbi:uncharacterized protein TNCV_2637541 [Trichonephila clavipes]|nr:uncharacterized protein TNCV_2637541 [Trichonephila clavipes]